MFSEKTSSCDKPPPATSAHDEEDNLSSRSSLEAIHSALAAAERLTNISSPCVLSTTRSHIYKNGSKVDNISNDRGNSFNVGTANNTSVASQEDCFAFNLQVILAAIVSVAEAERIDLERELRCRIRSLESENLRNDHMPPTSLLLPELFSTDGRGPALNLGLLLHPTTLFDHLSPSETAVSLTGRTSPRAVSTESTAVAAGAGANELQESLRTSACTASGDGRAILIGDLDSVSAAVQCDMYDDNNSGGDGGGGGGGGSECGKDVALLSENNSSHTRRSIPAPLQVATTEEENLIFLDPPASIEGMTPRNTSLDVTKNTNVNGVQNVSCPLSNSSGEGIKVEEEDTAGMQDKLSTERPFTCNSIWIEIQQPTEVTETHTVQDQQDFTTDGQTDNHATLRCDDGENLGDLGVNGQRGRIVSVAYSSVEVSGPDEAELPHERMTPNADSNTLLDLGSGTPVGERSSYTNEEMNIHFPPESWIPVPKPSPCRKGGSSFLPSESIDTPMPLVDGSKATASSQATATPRSTAKGVEGEAAISPRDESSLHVPVPLDAPSARSRSSGEEHTVLLPSPSFPSSSELALSFPAVNTENEQTQFIQLSKEKDDSNSAFFPRKDSRNALIPIYKAIPTTDLSSRKIESSVKDIPLCEEFDYAEVMLRASLSAKTSNIPSVSFSTLTVCQSTRDCDAFKSRCEQSTQSPAFFEVQPQDLSPFWDRAFLGAGQTNENNGKMCDESDNNDKNCKSERTITASVPTVALLPNIIEEDMSEEKVEVSEIMVPYSDAMGAHLLPFITSNDGMASISVECSSTTLLMAQNPQSPTLQVSQAASSSAISQKIQSSNVAQVISDTHARCLPVEFCVMVSPKEVSAGSMDRTLTKQVADVIHQSSREEIALENCTDAIPQAINEVRVVNQYSRSEENGKTEVGDRKNYPVSTLRKPRNELSLKSESESYRSPAAHSTNKCKLLYGLLLFGQVVRDLKKGTV